MACRPMLDALVIGAGPAGLMAAEMLADKGVSVLVADAMPTAGRKLLMAGKSGLNLTKDADFDSFIKAYGQQSAWLRPSLEAFGNRDVGPWAAALGQVVFTGSSGKVFPKSMKASPLLRNWLARLEGKKVTIQTRWRWQGWQDGALVFDTPEGPQTRTPRATVLALGGASWPRLGSNGDWTGILAGKGVALAPFEPANMGVLVPWSKHMNRHFGSALKNVTLHSGDKTRKGEFVITADGLEGSLVYDFSPQLRAGLPLMLDLCPDLSLEHITDRLAKVPPKNSLSNALRKALHLTPAAIGLLMEFAKPPQPRGALAKHLKALPVPYSGTAGIARAISVAGGIRRDSLNDAFMLTEIPGVFCAGEMLDWEAPTGGYLLTACLSTGRRAGLGAAAFVAQAKV